jgi:hypothetical protein
LGFSGWPCEEVEQPQAVPGENGVDSIDPKHANPAIKVLWSSGAGAKAG